jgi:hypothetical protein
VTSIERRRVFGRDDYTCRYCGDTATDLMPIVPVLLGGSDVDPVNLIAVDRPCYRRFEKALDDSVVYVAAAHRDELSRVYARAVEGIGRPRPLPPEIPDQVGILDLLGEEE